MYYKGKDNFSSALGGTVTVLALIGLVAYIVISMIAIFRRDNWTLDEQSVRVGALETFQNFTFTGALTCQAPVCEVPLIEDSTMVLLNQTIFLIEFSSQVPVHNRSCSNLTLTLQLLRRNETTLVSLRDYDRWGQTPLSKCQKRLDPQEVLQIPLL